MPQVMNGSQHDRQLIERVIATRDLTIVFQPIVDVQDGSIAAMEALSRPGVESGFASPAHLFHAAESQGLLWELEEVTREASFLAAAGWPAGRQLFLNSSPSVFADERFTDRVTALVDRTPGLGRARLVLEITELSEETHTSRLVTRAQELKQAGFGVAVDDAGAGTSGLNRIMSIRPHWIKLDREFVRNIHTDPFRQNLVRFFVQFARLSNIGVVAEGIESVEELSTVAALGVRFAQGYYLARPAAVDLANSPEIVEQVRERWLAIERAATTNGGWAAPNSAGVQRLVQAAPIVGLATTAMDALSALDSAGDAPGVIVAEGGRPIGWVWRGRVEEAAAQSEGAATIDQFMTGPMLRVPPSATLQEALEVACVMDDQPPADPILVSGGGRVFGVVRLRDVIRAATREGRVGAGQNGIAHLPSRIQTDRHIADVIASWKQAAPSEASALHTDVAIVDLQRLSECNAAFGYPFGDRMIRTLAEMIESEVAGPIHSCFLSHLGEDRFLLTAPAGTLEPRLIGLIERFEDFAAQVTPDGRTERADVVASINPQGSLRIAARVLLMPELLCEISHVRELYHREFLLRQHAARRDSAAADRRSPGSVLIRDELPPQGLSLSATG